MKQRVYCVKQSDGPYYIASMDYNNRTHMHTPFYDHAKFFPLKSSALLFINNNIHNHFMIEICKLKLL